jgi:hypothetical protein
MNQADYGELRAYAFDFTQSGAGDANSTVDLVRLPPGRYRLVPNMSRITGSAFGASRVLDVGHTGWTKPDGTAVAADAEAIVADGDVSSAATLIGKNTYVVVEAKAAVTIQAKVAGGTIPDGATLNGFITVIRSV